MGFLEISQDYSGLSGVVLGFRDLVVTYRLRAKGQ